MKKIVGIVILLVVFAGGYWLVTSRNNPDGVENVSKISPEPTTSDVSDNEVRVEEAAATFVIPDGFQFSKERQMNLTTNEPYAVSFTVQNYKETISEVKEPYQLYGLYQWDTAKTSVEAFKKSNFELDPATVQEFTVGDRPAISGVAQGERARYITYILYNGHLLTLAASETTQAQRSITDAIVKSIRFD